MDNVHWKVLDTWSIRGTKGTSSWSCRRPFPASMQHWIWVSVISWLQLTVTREVYLSKMARTTLRDPDVLNVTSIIDNYMLLSDATRLISFKPVPSDLNTALYYLNALVEQARNFFVLLRLIIETQTSCYDWRYLSFLPSLNLPNLATKCHSGKCS